VDDDATTQATVSGLLSARGHRVVLAHRATDAAGMLRETRFDLIVMELRLPDGRGEEFIRMLRREWGIDTPVILLAAEVTAEVLDFLHPDRAWSFLSKSGDYEFRLVTAVAAALAGAAEAGTPPGGGDDWVKDL
jgi:CheY-like chemotaxis protein